MKKKYKEKTWFYDIGMITGMWTWLVWFRPKRYFVDGKFKLKGSEICAEIMRKRGNIKSTDEAYSLIIQDFRNNKIANITLDRL